MNALLVFAASPNEEKAEVAQLRHGYGVREPILSRVVNEITSAREQ